ncbi:Protocadherin-9 [Clonorchis sinensis]|uniref:Protocadherin-9 n=1 Tax=Clonorchis sinensis TaxID=79923 RepID=A0A419QE04_CLOSI|nr:Protocadherin-9 [Clonorchis sinensis]
MWKIPIFALLIHICRCEEKSSLHINIELEEEVPRTTIVAEMDTLIAHQLTHVHRQLEEGTQIAQMTVQFLEPNNLFYLHSTQSELTLKTSSDFYTRQQLVQLNIYLLDVNDNAPSWQTHSSVSVSLQNLNESQAVRNRLLPTTPTIPRLDLSVPEHTAIGTRISLPSAIDPDASPENTTSSYGIETQSMPDAFVLDWDRTVIGLTSLDNPASSLWLVVNRDLSHDEQSEHHVIVYASDAGRPKPLTGYLLINISVTDINDHPPKFLKRSDMVSVREHTTVGTSIYQPTVHDADPSDRLRLTFGFRPSTSSVSRQRFRVDPRKGEISIHGVVDYEQSHFHQLFIFVSDGKWTDEMELDVHIININDHAPEIQLHSHLVTGLPDLMDYHANVPYAQLTILVLENGPTDQLIATMTVTDKDSTAELRARNFITPGKQKELLLSETYVQRTVDPPGNILQPVCSISNQQFKIEPLVVDGMKQMEEKFRFKISLAGKSLDREKQPRVVVKIICHDQYNHQQSIVQQTAPEFRSYVHQQSAQIRTTTALLRIIVSDENDSKPQFLGPLTAQLSEDAPVDTVVARLKATDEDDPHTSAGNLGLRFQLLQPSRYIPSKKNDKDEEINKSTDIGQVNGLELPPEPWFHLNSVTGELKVLVKFDREQVRSILLTVQIRDGGDMDQSMLLPENTRMKINNHSTINRINATVTIDIKDANDCVPKFSQQLYEFNITEDAVPPMHVGKLDVTDCDVDDTNSQITYWLQTSTQAMTITQSPQEHIYKQSHSDANIHSWFSVSKSGDLFLRTPQTPIYSPGTLSTGALTPLDRERNELIVMDVFARDAGSPSLTGSAQLLIRVLDVNDHAPEWEFPKPLNRMVNLSLDTAIGSRVAQLVAFDPDEGPRGLVLYSILSGDEGGQFELDANSGWIYLAQSLKHKRVPTSPRQSSEPQHHSKLNQFSDKWTPASPTMLRLYVQASDCGTPPRSSSSVLDIIIQQSQSTPDSTLSVQPQAREQTRRFGNSEEEKLLLSRSIFDLHKQHKWSRDQEQYGQRGLLVPSDFLTLIAMVTATLAALVLIFILFVVFRCRRLRIAEHVPSGHRTHPENAYKTSLAATTRKPPHSAEDGERQSFKQKCASYAFWSRFGLHRHPTRRMKHEPQQGGINDFRPPTTYAPIPILFPHIQGTLGSTGSLAESPDRLVSEQTPHGNTLLYAVRSSDQTTVHSQQTNCSMNSGNYNLTVHGSHPLDDKIGGQKYARICLNNSHNISKYMCDLPTGSDIQLLHTAAYGVCEFKQSPAQTSIGLPLDDTAEVMLCEENPLDVESKQNAAVEDYIPLRHILSKSKSEVNSLSQPSSFV